MSKTTLVIEPYPPLERREVLLEELQNKMPESVIALIDHAANICLSTDMLSRHYSASGFLVVDPDHFDDLDNLGTARLVRSLLLDADARFMVEHELGLMLQEIHDLRHVLADRAGINWTEYRRKFPLLAQER